MLGIDGYGVGESAPQPGRLAAATTQRVTDRLAVGLLRDANGNTKAVRPAVVQSWSPRSGVGYLANLA